VDYFSCSDPPLNVFTANADHISFLPLVIFISSLCTEKESMGKSDLFFLGSFSPLVDLRVSTGVKIFCSPCGTRERKNCEEIPEIYSVYKQAPI
jgi:hypothetical protein